MESVATLRIQLIQEKRLHAFIFFFLNIDKDGRLHTKIFDKRDDFNFPLINFPFLSSNIPYAPSYGFYMSQLRRYARYCSHCIDFTYRSVLLTQKMLQQTYEEKILKTTLRKIYGHNHEMVDLYDVFVSNLTNDVLEFGLPSTSSVQNVHIPDYDCLPSVNSHCFTTCQCIYTSKIHVFSYAVYFVSSVGYYVTSYRL